jgi:lipoprotein-anchoring transpeptidase ErfK/SrfK
MGRRKTMGRWMSEEFEDRRAAPGEGVTGMTRRRALAATAGLLGLAATPGMAADFVHTIGPRANHLVVSKSLRVLELRRGADILKRYRVDLGFTPQGHKLRSGDGRTPEGRYWIDRRNPRSEFFLSIGINYPNEADLARAKAMGVDPGGNIFIHGEPMRERKRVDRDWTAGCIAVTNREMEEIWALTPTGVPITILA